MSNWYITYSDEDLMHHGVIGMKWGVRRYQKKDGSYTYKGKASIGTNFYKNMERAGYSKKNTNRLIKNTAIGTLIGGPLVGVTVGLITNGVIKKEIGQKKVSELKKKDV